MLLLDLLVERASVHDLHLGLEGHIELFLSRFVREDLRSDLYSVSLQILNVSHWVYESLVYTESIVATKALGQLFGHRVFRPTGRLGVLDGQDDKFIGVEFSFVLLFIVQLVEHFTYRLLEHQDTRDIRLLIMV